MIKMLEKKVGEYSYDCWIQLNDYPKQGPNPES